MAIMKADKKTIIFASVAVLLLAAYVTIKIILSGAFYPGPSEGPFSADNECPQFKAEYPICKVQFGNSGLSLANSAFETFVGEGAFEINSFNVTTKGEQRYSIVAQSNRGPLTSEIYADGIVRLGQDREDEVVYRTHQSAYCDGGRIYEHQTVHRNGSIDIQDLEFWTEDGKFRFRLFQNGAPTADVVCTAE